MGSNKFDKVHSDYAKMEEAANPDRKKSLTEKLNHIHMTDKEIVDEKYGQSFSRNYGNQND
jgi:hypothetical protein